jgi:hypothetical protein
METNRTGVFEYTYALSDETRAMARIEMLDYAQEHLKQALGKAVMNATDDGRAYVIKTFSYETEDKARHCLLLRRATTVVLANYLEAGLGEYVANVPAPPNARFYAMKDGRFFQRLTIGWQRVEDAQTAFVFPQNSQE